MSLPSIFPDWIINQLKAVNEANLAEDSNLSHAITIKRTVEGRDTTLAPQWVRIKQGLSTGRSHTDGDMEEVQADVTLIGDVSLDVQPKDRFYLQDTLYHITVVYPADEVGRSAGALIKQ